MAKRPPISRETHLLATYGITVEAYEALEQAQNYKCKLCSRHKDELTRRVLDVDHDHETNRIRGLLCNNCNTGLGLFKDNPTTLLRAIQYLKGSL
jgi:hypothetical protein